MGQVLDLPRFPRYWCDKMLLLWGSRVPPPYDHRIAGSAAAYLPSAGVLHLCLTIWCRRGARVGCRICDAIFRPDVCRLIPLRLEAPAPDLQPSSIGKLVLQGTS